MRKPSPPTLRGRRVQSIDKIFKFHGLMPRSHVVGDPAVSLFPTQHRHLVELLNIAYDNFVEGAPVENLSSLLEDLIEYSTNHFNAESRA